MKTADQQIIQRLNEIYDAQAAPGGGAPAFADITGAPEDNAALDTALDLKQTAAQVQELIDATPGVRKSVAATAHGFVVGDVLRMDGTAYVKAQSDSDTNAEAIGMVASVTDANNFILATGGFVSGLSGLTAGAMHFLDPTTAGAITDTEPTTDGQISKPVFIATTTTAGYFFNMRGSEIGASASTGTVFSYAMTAGDKISGGGTEFHTFVYTSSGNAGVSSLFHVTESFRQMFIAKAGTLSSFYVRSTDAQPADGDLVLTVRVNGVDTGITITIAANSAAGTFSDLTHSAVVAVGDLVSFSAVKSSGPSESATLQHWAIIVN